jgi:hypothetical protein
MIAPAAWIPHRALRALNSNEHGRKVSQDMVPTADETPVRSWAGTRS